MVLKRKYRERDYVLLFFPISKFDKTINGLSRRFKMRKLSVDEIDFVEPFFPICKFDPDIYRLSRRF